MAGHAGYIGVQPVYAHSGSHKSPGTVHYRIGASSDGNQGGKMAVTVAKFESFYPASGRLDGIADRPRSGVGKNGLAVLFPRSVQRLEARGREALAGLVVPLVEVIAARWC